MTTKSAAKSAMLAPKTPHQCSRSSRAARKPVQQNLLPKEVDPDHPLLTLLDGVNERMTGPELKYVTMALLVSPKKPPNKHPKKAENTEPNNPDQKKSGR